MTTSAVYNVEDEIAAFFTKTSVTRQACDDRAKDIAGGTVTPIKIQGFCSYSVYAGPNLEYVVQFRPKSLELKTENTMLAKQLYGTLAPEVSFVGQLGDDDAGKEPLYIYLANRVRGVTQLEFNLTHACADNSQETFAWRKTLMGDMARYTIPILNTLFINYTKCHSFFALAWKSPQLMDVSQRNRLRQTYTTELQLLLTALPVRFRTTIQSCIDSVDAILSLPMVLLHQDFGDSNIMVDETTCHLVGIIDWAEAEIGPFGLNLFALESLSGKLHLQNGWSRYEDYDILQDTFWNTFKKEVGGVTKEDLRTVSLARTTGLLLTHGFTSRLANDPDHVPIGDDERGRYNMLSLDGFLINLVTRFEV
ncbi:hypothetical protein V501_04639 [Pseudogymnoascus sp. VKM F-4519 (FW-2642)]|nr:hypothetical protein V501_04639 [Pseudogymnoascus sp. VKM F-4519 (FW-2642)]